MRKPKASCVKDTAIRLALREMQSLIRNARAWALMLAIGIVLGLSGPYDTIDVLPFLPRLGYWTFAVVVAFLTGSFIGTTCEIILMRWHVKRWLVFPIVAAMIALVVAGEIILLNWLVFNLPLFDPMNALILYGNTFVISLLVSIGLSLFAPPMAKDGSSAIPRLLQRLPLEKRGALISVSVQDHYVDVFTDKGHELLLLRLSDAIAETAPIEGLQTHRSHWVAIDQVASAVRDGNKAILTLRDGRDIPVSRTYLNAIRDAGLLPR